MLTVAQVLRLNEYENILNIVRLVLSKFSDADKMHITRIEMSFDMVFDMNISGELFNSTFNPFNINHGVQQVGSLFGYPLVIIDQIMSTHNMSVHFDKKYVRYKKIYNILNDVDGNYIREVYKYKLDDNYQKIKSIL